MNELESLLEGRAPIPRILVMRAMDCEDLRAQYLAYRAATRAYRRVRPDLGLLVAGEFLLDYYLMCMAREKTTSPEQYEDLHSRYEAAGELAGFLELAWKHRQETEELVTTLVDRVTRLYLESDEALRNCIETGFLEHALERPALRPLFQRWEHQPELIDAYRGAMEWGLAHERSE